MAHDFRAKRRNTNHWDIWINNERIFCIRGAGQDGTNLEEGKFYIRSENSLNYMLIDLEFETPMAAMNWITNLLMHPETAYTRRP